MEFRHTPVLLEEIVNYLPEKAKVAIDLTLGGAGHSLGLLEKIPQLFLYAVDRDQDALKAGAGRFKQVSAEFDLYHCSFADATEKLISQGVKTDYIIADFGVSSHQIDQKERGFSFRADAPLDMRMDQREKITAATIVNNWERKELVRILRSFGEEPFASKISYLIVKKREVAPIRTTWELADIVRSAVPKKFQFGRLHPATKTFQALRIAVNQELEQIERMLKNALQLLNFGGRLAIISFHSLEDRIVKKVFKNWEQPCTCPKSIPICICGLKPEIKILHRKTITAGKEELEKNPRSRSARLRVMEKL
ncbi:MAG: 16S rRNA (cytosine(1402)-N(4))-methyltransferase RsmH [Proteobacteria bacterium]|nr:16S rRNA (cytosine(1402)-N(4))-methyltransferase RsmH [Pseudomonadota bacterium]